MSESVLTEEQLSQEFVSNLANYAANYHIVIKAAIAIGIAILGDILFIVSVKSANSEILEFLGKFLMSYAAAMLVTTIVRFKNERQAVINEIRRKQNIGDEDFVSTREAYIKARRSGAKFTVNKLGFSNIEKLIELGETLLEIESLEKAKALLEQEALKASESKDVIEEESNEA